MYDVSNTRASAVVEEFEPGTNVLITGPSMVGKREFTLELLTAGQDQREGLLLVMTGESAMVVTEDLERGYETPSAELIGVVDCSNRDVRKSSEGDLTRSLESPNDLTGIGVSTAKLYEQLTSHGVTSVRHGFISVTTLLQFLDLETVFKFLHIYTRRISNTGGFGAFTFDPTAYDTRTLETIVRLFDGVAELRRRSDGGRELCLSGIDGAADEWCVI